MSGGTRGRGEHWEGIAAAHLVRAGLRELARNLDYRVGELDLVLLDRDILVVAEVRYRAGKAQGGGLESITRSKRDRLRRASAAYLAAHPEHARRALRFDVVAISGTESAPEIEWLRDAFRDE